jgi:hypothetical protein
MFANPSDEVLVLAESCQNNNLFGISSTSKIDEEEDDSGEKEEPATKTRLPQFRSHSNSERIAMEIGKFKNKYLHKPSVDKSSFKLNSSTVMQNVILNPLPKNTHP